MILGLQVLRAIAACAVVWSHAYSRAERTWPGLRFLAPAEIQQLGHFGVDLFFCLSGFLMVYLHAHQFGKAGAPLAFIRRRLWRIVPLYWLLTTAAIALLFFAPRLFSYHTGIEFGWLLGCYLFVPWPMADGFNSPAIGAGWTLGFEMHFYVLFAAALLFRRGLYLVFAALTAAVFAGMLLEPAHPWLRLLTHPMLTEFLMGGLVALLVKRWRAPPVLAMCGIIVAAWLIILGGHFYTHSAAPYTIRALTWGAPCALLLYCVATLNPPCSGPISRAAVLTGDASYSVYLFQVFALPAAAIAMRQTGIASALPPDVAALLLCVLSCGAGFCCWKFVERQLPR